MQLKVRHFVALTGAALILGGVYLETRGVRNRNPLNIEKGADWVGLAVDQSGDSRFAIFTHEKYGFRAGARILRTYRDEYDRRSVKRIIERWAPEHENDTEAYIDFVMKHTGFWFSSAPLSEKDWPILLQAMAIMETGKTYPLSVIEEGISLA